MKTYKIGDVLNYKGVPSSEVVGIDRYRLNSLAGIEDSWVSYTLVSKENGVFARWWMAQIEGKEYMWLACDKSEFRGALDEVRSGLAVLEAEGNSINSSPYSSLAIFRDGDNLYCLEAFEGSNDVLCMRGTLLS